VPQSTTPLHPSGAFPQLALSCEHVRAVHPHWLGWPAPPQDIGAGHAPQSSTSAHPSETNPQLASSCMHVRGLHVFAPHTFSPPPPQVCPDGHSPHGATPSHPSTALPHCAPSCAQVCGTQTEPSRAPTLEASSPEPHELKVTAGNPVRPNAIAH
jgi:hypothetical protein